ncbi:hypothetical protein HMPREF3198_02033 [Winkia neuii]|nr:hypothetical protein HMPREF3198_02033 [Winkia neuii]
MWTASAPKLFPARAGVIPSTGAVSIAVMSFPRASGGNSEVLPTIRKTGSFSPRERG